MHMSPSVHTFVNNYLYVYYEILLSIELIIIIIYEIFWFDELFGVRITSLVYIILGKIS